MTQFGERRLRSGYSDLGPIKIPPMPQYIQLTDTATGTKYIVSYNTSNNALIAQSNLSVQDKTRIFTKDEGPWFPENPRYRLTITNGVFGKTLDAAGLEIEASRNMAPIYARNGNSARQILLSEF